MLTDLHYALRSLRKAPAFTFVAVVTLALGVGATTAIFSVVNGVLLKPLPYADPDGLVMVWEHNFPRGRDRNVVSPANFFTWTEQAQVLEDLAALVEGSGTLTGGGEPERVGVVTASASLFPLLGVQPRIGRAYTPEEDRDGAPRVAVLGYGYWQRRFGADPAVIGRDLTLNGRPLTIVGVLPQGFEVDLPVKFGWTGTQDLWVPHQFDEGDRAASGRYLQVIGRRGSGVTVQQAQDRMSALARQLEQDFPERQTGWGVNLVPLEEQLVGDVRKALLLILGAVTFVLLIACANVASLLLARSIERRQEVTLRAALGASRARTIRQLLAESLLLAGAGGGLGAVLAWAAVDALKALSPDIPRIEQVTVDATVLGFALVMSAVTGLLFGVAPALRGSNVELGASLKESGARSGGGAGVMRARNSLVIAEIALSIVLLAGAGLLMRSFANLLDVGVGFETERLVLADVPVPTSRYPEASQRARAFESLVERVQALPGVQSATAILFPPLSGAGSATSFWVNDRPIPPQGEAPVADLRWVQRDYARTMGIPLLAGRFFERTDGEGAPLRVVVNKNFAETFWPGESAIGRSLSMPWGDTLVAEIVGVVEDVLHNGPRTEVRPKIYWHHQQFQPFTLPMTLVVRTATDGVDVAPALRAEARAVDPSMPIYNLRSMESALSETLARARLATVSLGAFSLIALILAAVGVYGVLAYSVSQRTREFGVRMAVGADQATLARLVLTQGTRLVVVGLVIGAAVALAVSRLMEGLVFEVGTRDPLSFMGAAAVLGAVALLASYLPARRAARVDPMEALRYE
ncbi:MAG TPA: ABC transporter permease [Gemmatimonadales bacterium]|nr:ABC transporter permease [Gemmatimonadales bacterium]